MQSVTDEAPSSDSTTVASPVPLDEHGTIVVDAPCIQCQYNLRGLRPKLKCPECGTPVRKSITAPLLRCEDPEWLRSVCSGLTLVAVATLGVLALLGLAAMTGAVAVFGLGVVCLTVTGALGVWVATRPRPVDQRAGTARYRVLARLAIVANGIAALFLGIIALSGGPSAGADEAIGCCGFLYTASFGLLTVAFLLHLNRLMRCTPASDLVRWSRRLAAVCGLASGLTSVGTLFIMGRASHGNVYGMLVLWSGMLAGALSLIGVSPLLILARNAVDHERRIAEAWRAPRVVDANPQSADFAD
jgi:hypothetical protein